MADDLNNPLVDPNHAPVMEDEVQDKLLQQAMEERDQRQKYAMLLKGFQQLAQAGVRQSNPNYNINTSTADTITKTANQPVQDILLQRKQQLETAQELRKKLQEGRAAEKFQLDKDHRAKEETRKEAREGRDVELHEQNLKSAQLKLKGMGLNIEDKERLNQFLSRTEGPVANAVRQDLQSELSKRSPEGQEPEMLPEGISLYELNKLHDYFKQNKQGGLTEYQKEMLKLKKQEMDSKRAKVGQKPSKAQESADKEFGKEYASWVAGGKSADARKSIKQLQEVYKKLGETDTATGSVVGLLPKKVRDIVTPEGAALQDSVEEIVQRNLRLVLGAQFTEKEGERLIDRAYNPRQSEEENQKRVKRLLDQIMSAAKAKEDAIRHYEANDTLMGFQGKVYTSAEDFEKDLAFDEGPTKKAPYGEEVEKGGKKYKWNSNAGRYQLISSGGASGGF